MALNQKAATNRKFNSLCRKLFFTLSLLITTITIAFSQSSLTGKVVAENEKPADAASVILLAQADSSMIKSALTEANGSYMFNNIKEGRYIVSVSMIGYKKHYAPVNITGAKVQTPVIQLVVNAKQLNEITVTASRPFLEQRPDKLVVNVAGSPTAAGSTALEVLQKVPGVLISNDKVTMVGKGTPVIMVDGRPSQYTDVAQVLKDLSAANIDRIEVIANPGAKYDAAGGSVINVVLKQNVNLGTNGSFSLSSGMGIYDQTKDKVDRNFYRLSPTLSLNHRHGKFSLFSNYSFFHRNQYDYNEFSRIINTNRFLQTSYNPNDADSHNFRVGVDFYADKKNTLGIMATGFTRDGLRESNSNTQQLAAPTDQLLSSFQNINTTKTSRTNFSGNLNWKHSFDTAGTELNVDADYSRFKINNNSNIINRLSDGSQYINTQLTDNPVEFAVFKVDYAHPFNKNAKIEAGSKSSIATIDNFLTYMSNGAIDNNRSTDFKYTENINTAYATYQHKLENWEFQAGLRTEQTVATGKSQNQEVLNRNYWQLFPSVFVTREITGKIATIAQYSRRVNRPSYQQQNPFIEYIDSLTYTRGNPLLKPETADQYKLSVTYDNQPFFALTYNKKHDVIFDNAPKQEGNLTYTTSENLASYDNFAAELNFPIQFGKKISGYGGNQFIYNRYKAQYLGDTYDRGKWNWLAYWNVSYKPTDSWSFEVSGYYLTRFLNEFIMINNLGSLDFGVQKSLWNKKGKLSLNCEDILFTDKTKASIQYQAIDVNFRQRYESRNVRLTFSYSFGNQNVKAARDRKTASEAEAGRVKTN
jgi:hypothetical protein